MLHGMHYDLDASRIIGYTVPYWSEKNSSFVWDPTVQIWKFNTTAQNNISITVTHLPFQLDDNDFLLNTGATTLDIVNDVYYLAMPSLWNTTDVAEYQSRIYAIGLNEPPETRILMKEMIPYQVVNLEVNARYHGLYAYIVVDDGVKLGWSDKNQFVFLRLGYSYKVTTVPDLPAWKSSIRDDVALDFYGFSQDFVDDVNSSVFFTWTFDNWTNWSFNNTSLYYNDTLRRIDDELIRQWSMDNSNFSDKQFQVGGGTQSHSYNATFCVYKDNADADANYRVLKIRPTFDDWDPNLTDRGQLNVPPVQASWLMNADPRYSWFDFTYPIEGAHFSMNRSVVYVRFGNHTVSGLTPIDVDGDSLPDVYDWSGQHVGEMNCSDVLSRVRSVGNNYWRYSQDYILNAPDAICRWVGSTMEIHLSWVGQLRLGDRLTFKPDTIWRYRPDLDIWERPATPQVSDAYVQKPDPIFYPVIILDTWSEVVVESPWYYGETMKVWANSAGAKLCGPISADTSASYYHGGVQKWYWRLDKTVCFSAGGLQFPPNEFITVGVAKGIESFSYGARLAPYGTAFMNFSYRSLEPGCNYTFTVSLTGFWELTSYQTFMLSKEPPNYPPDWKPTCDFFCNPATCEPPSYCDEDNLCVCAENLWGVFCNGVCPPCEVFLGSWCDDGRLGSGKCICRLGFVGRLCNEMVEWRFGDWSECFGPCNSPNGTRFRTLNCVNTITDNLEDPSNCLPPDIGAEEFCVPDLCGDCLYPAPFIEGGNDTAMVETCPNATDGGICEPICLPGHVPVGKFLCSKGSFVEFGRCPRVGTPLVAVKGVSMVMNFGGIPEELVMPPNSAQSYLETSTLGPSLISALSGALPIGPEAIVLRAQVQPDQRRLRSLPEPQVPPGPPVPALLPNENMSQGLVLVDPAGRRLQYAPGINLVDTDEVNIDVTALIAVHDQSLMAQVMSVLTSFGEEPVRLQILLEAEMRKLCKDDASKYPAGQLCYLPGTFLALPPVEMQLYFDEEEMTALNEVWAAQIPPPVPIPQPLDETPKDAFTMGVAVGLAVGVVVLGIVIASGASILVYKKQQRLARIKQAELSSPRRSVMALDDRAKSEPDRIYDSEGVPITGHVRHETEDGTIYIGYVLHGYKQGEGWVEWTNGRSYIGQWLEGQLHGQGIMQKKGIAGWAYSGQFKEGQRHGVGRCEWPEHGSWYDGEWLHGQQHGQGEAGEAGGAPAMDSMTKYRIMHGDFHIAGDSSSPAELPPTAYIWRMERGLPQESLRVSPVSPFEGSLLIVELVATEQDWMARDKAKARPGRSGFFGFTSLNRPHTDDENVLIASPPEEGNVLQHDTDLQRVSNLWGVAFGQPSSCWLAGRWGALLLTRVLEGGALARWNMQRYQATGEPDNVVLPNALIWGVNGIEGDPARMAEELCADERLRRRLVLKVRNPPYMSFVEDAPAAVSMRPGSVPPPLPPPAPPGRPPPQRQLMDVSLPSLPELPALPKAAAPRQDPRSRSVPPPQTKPASSMFSLPSLPSLPGASSSPSSQQPPSTLAVRSARSHSPAPVLHSSGQRVAVVAAPKAAVGRRLLRWGQQRQDNSPSSPSASSTAPRQFIPSPIGQLPNYRHGPASAQAAANYLGQGQRDPRQAWSPPPARPKAPPGPQHGMSSSSRQLPHESAPPYLVPPPGGASRSDVAIVSPTQPAAAARSARGQQPSSSSMPPARERHGKADSRSASAHHGATSTSAASSSGAHGQQFARQEAARSIGPAQMGQSALSTVQQREATRSVDRRQAGQQRERRHGKWWQGVSQPPPDAAREMQQQLQEQHQQLRQQAQPRQPRAPVGDRVVAPPRGAAPHGHPLQAKAPPPSGSPPQVQVQQQSPLRSAARVPKARAVPPSPAAAAPRITSPKPPARR
eukprot:TRINITY_DN45044_c0_g1_i4.p1 TRINITY_DN45044_c0_g1~~TRINITY_DN45044_c0_g1_i4.p1  ORF type:complete len:1897 (+),score=311.57 TRINITY_DN45044_c0_g1_i4:400-6090(+)